MSYDQTKDAILADPAASEWLKRAVLALDKRDPVDAGNDAADLANLQESRLRELMPESPGRVIRGKRLQEQTALDLD